MKLFKSPLALLTVIIFGVLMVSCKKKDKKEEPTPVHPNAKLVLGTWSPTKYVTIYAGQTYYQDVESCTADDMITLMANGTYYFDEGPTKCSPDDSQSFQKTYSVSEDGKNITIAGNTGKLAELTDSSMVIKFSLGPFGTQGTEYKKLY